MVCPAEPLNQLHPHASVPFKLGGFLRVDPILQEACDHGCLPFNSFIAKGQVRSVRRLGASGASLTQVKAIAEGNAAPRMGGVTAWRLPLNDQLTILSSRPGLIVRNSRA